MGQDVFEDELGQIEFQAGSRRRLRVDRGPIYRGFFLRLEGQLDVTSGNSTQGNLVDADEWGVINELRLVQNQNRPLITLSAYELKMLQLLQYGSIPELSSELGDGSKNSNFNGSELLLSPAAVGMVKPADSWINSQRQDINTLHLEADWGDETDVNTSADGFTTDPVLHVDANFSSGYTGPAFDQRFIVPLRETDISTNTAKEYEFTADRNYRGFLIHTEVGGNDRLLTDVINNVKLKAANTVFKDLEGRDLLRRMRKRKSIDDGRTWARSNNANIDSFGYLEVPSDGRLSETLDARNLDRVKLEIDQDGSNGTTDVNILAESYILAANEGQSDGTQKASTQS